MFDGLEGREGFTDDTVVYSRSLCSDGGGHRVVDVMLSAEGKFLEVDVALILFVPYNYLVVLQESTLLNLSLLGEWQTLGAEDYLVEVVDGDLVVRIEDEAVFRLQVPGDAELGLHSFPTGSHTCRDGRG